MKGFRYGGKNVSGNAGGDDDLGDVCRMWK